MSVQMWLRQELPFVHCRVEHKTRTVELEALIDTGATIKRDKADNLSSVIPRETRNLVSQTRDSSFLSE